MENQEVVKVEIFAEDILNNGSESPVLVKSEIVPSEVNSADEKIDCPPRRNGLFSITGNLKVHRNYASGK